MYRDFNPIYQIEKYFTNPLSNLVTTFDKMSKNSHFFKFKYFKTYEMF